jgi:hypothetical protein
MLVRNLLNAGEPAVHGAVKLTLTAVAAPSPTGVRPDRANVHEIPFRYRSGRVRDGRIDVGHEGGRPIRAGAAPRLIIRAAAV